MTSALEKKARLLRTYLGRHPVWCTWQITYRCNFRCGFCPYWHDEMARLPEQSVDQFARGARKLAQWGTLLVSLAGGEPLLRSDLVDIVRVVGRWHFPFITTNGYRLTPQLARDLFAGGLWGVSVSIDYADPDRHDHARGKEHAFARAVRALELFSRARRYPWQRVNLMAVLLHDNLDQVEPLLRLAARYDAYFMIQPYCARKTGDPRFLPRRNGPIGSYLVDLRRRYPNFLSNPLFLARFDMALTTGVPGCAAGRAFFNIDSTGAIALCVEQRRHPVAHLYRHGAAEISRRLRAAAATNHCRDCWYNCRGEVESLYHFAGLLRSLPTWIFDHGRPSQKLSRRCLVP